VGPRCLQLKSNSSWAEFSGSVSRCNPQNPEPPRTRSITRAFGLRRFFAGLVVDGFANDPLPQIQLGLAVSFGGVSSSGCGLELCGGTELRGTDISPQGPPCLPPTCPPPV
jgi:hypothetical protein